MTQLRPRGTRTQAALSARAAGVLAAISIAVLALAFVMGVPFARAAEGARAQSHAAWVSYRQLETMGATVVAAAPSPTAFAAPRLIDQLDSIYLRTIAAQWAATTQVPVVDRLESMYLRAIARSWGHCTLPLIDYESMYLRSLASTW